MPAPKRQVPTGWYPNSCVTALPLASCSINTCFPTSGAACKCSVLPAASYRSGTVPSRTTGPSPAAELFSFSTKREPRAALRVTLGSPGSRAAWAAEAASRHGGGVVDRHQLLVHHGERHGRARGFASPHPASTRIPSRQPRRCRRRIARVLQRTARLHYQHREARRRQPVRHEAARRAPRRPRCSPASPRERAPFRVRAWPSHLGGYGSHGTRRRSLKNPSVDAKEPAGGERTRQVCVCKRDVPRTRNGPKISNNYPAYVFGPLRALERY